MIYGEIRGLPKPLPKIVLGTLALSHANKETFHFLDSAHAMGCYAFDTAVTYGDGASERTLGDWMQARNNRSDVIVVGKGAHPAEGHDRVDPESIKQDLRESLDRLRTDYIDLYLLHRDNPSVPVGPIIEVLNDLKREGKVVLFGASNWTSSRLEEAKTYAQSNGLVSFSAASCQYSLAVQYDDPYPGTVSVNRETSSEDWEWYQATGFPLLAWSSLARGFFSGRFTRENLDTFTDPQSQISIRCYAKEDNFARLDRTRELAKERGCTVAQIALAYLFHQPLNSFAISGAANTTQLKENAGALEIDLSDDELKWLNRGTL